MTEDKTAEFFIELLSEEMPARIQLIAEGRLRDNIGAKLRALGLLDIPEDAFYEEIEESWSTPRRLAVCFSNVRVIQPPREEEKRGPRADAPAEAINGFLRSAGITKEEAEIRKTPKGEFYFAVQKHEGRKAADILPILIAEVIANFKWPKSMRWGTGQKRWVRPLHGIVALFDGKALKGEIDFGSGQTVSLSNKTRGHRFLDDNQSVTITSGATYKETMKKHLVIVSRYWREHIIKKQIKGQNEGNKSLEIVNTDLLREVVGLVEYPNVIEIKIDKEFMTLPERIRITTMETHQKFLHLSDKKTGEFLPNFIVVADSFPDKERDERIRAGAERVMRARLADARFSLEEDEKTGLDAMLKRLDAMAFFYGLGTMGDKTERLIKLMRDYADLFEVDKGEIEKVARYAKADLASNTVNEFPTLQGFMGGHLTRQEYGDVVADAIADHYSDDSGFSRDNSEHQYYLKDRLERYLGLMDRIDTLAAFIAIGKMPTGSKDPYALRRAGSSIVGIITRVKESVPLGEIFYKTLDYLEEGGVRLSKPREELYDDFTFFIHDRARNMVENYEVYRSFNFDVEDEVISAEDEVISAEDEVISAEDEVISAVDGFYMTLLDAVFHRDTKDKDRIKYLCYLVGDLNDFIGKPEGIDLMAAYKRLANILDAEDKKNAEQRGKLEVGLFNDSAESRLHNAIKEAQNALFDAKKTINRVDKEIEALKSLTEPINAFLDEIRVNDEDPKIRQNRLNLLNRVRTEIKKVADFDKIQ